MKKPCYKLYSFLYYLCAFLKSYLNLSHFSTNIQLKIPYYFPVQGGKAMNDENKNPEEGSIEKEKLGNTLDYYNDELSRKAVGKLFNNTIDDFDSSEEKEQGLDDLKPKTEDISINNHFYEESRAANSDSDGRIVKGFKSAESEDGGRSSVGEELGSYRKRVLDDFYSASARTPVRRKTEPVKTEKRSRNISSKKMQKDEDILFNKESEEEEDSEIQEVKYTKIERPVRQREPVARQIPRDRPQRERSERRTQSAASQNVTSVPLFKILCAAIGIMLIITVVLVFQVNSISGQLEKYKTAEAEFLEEKENYDSIVKAKESAEQLTRTLQEENAALNLKIKELEAGESNATETPAPEETPSTTSPQGTQSTYTVVAGDTLSAVSQKFYGNTLGVDKIMKANNLANENLKIGQVLTIPQ